MYPRLQQFINSGGQSVSKMYTLNNAVEQEVLGVSLRIDATQKMSMFVAIDNASGRPVKELTHVVMEDLRIMTLFGFFADYRRVKEHNVFRQIYGYAPRAVSYVSGNGETIQKTFNTFPCGRCGIVMPEHLTTIDHQKPQAGGERLALLKTFRLFGLTDGGPRGKKGKEFAGQADSFRSMYRAMMQDTGRWTTHSPHPAASPDGMKTARQTLNIEGMIIYSALKAAGDLPDALHACMHSIVNLKPLCLRCNTSKGNSVLG